MLASCSVAAAVCASAAAIAAYAAAGDSCPCGDEWPSQSSQSSLAKYEYSGCDFDVLDDMPSQEHFDARYWNRAPVLIRNGTRDWPARTRWTKRALLERMRRGRPLAGYLRTDDHWASFYSIGNESLTAERGALEMEDFLCRGVCLPPAHTDQVYLFDRDEWRDALPGLEEDLVHPPPIAAHFDPAWHERWSLYLLVSALGSGINFHQHAWAC